MEAEYLSEKPVSAVQILRSEPGEPFGRFVGYGARLQVLDLRVFVGFLSARALL